MKDKIEQAIKKVLPGTTFMVERPRDIAHGDYSTNAALVAKADPRELAAQLKIDGVEKIEVAGKFINFFLSREALVPKEQKISQLNAGKKILLEYTSPNLFKPLHIGNLVSNILGESVARLLEYTGATVVRINYPSDIGLTVAKSIWGLQKLSLSPHDIAELGRAYVAGTESYEGAAKQEIEAINKALYEDTDPVLSALRAAGIATSRKHLDELCARLGTTFDKEFFESESGPIGRDLVRANTGAIFEESEGAVVYRGEQDGLHTRVFLTSQGLPTYEAKDLGLLKLKLGQYPDFDITITDTGPEQTEYFKVLYAAARKVLPELTGKTLEHIAHGYLKLTSGKMSSRMGNVITGESLLADLTKAARGREDVAVGAIKYTVLRSGSGKDIIFDPEKSLSLEGDSGPYLQYALVRARSLLRKAAEATVAKSVAPQVMALERVLIHFPDVALRAAKEMEPHYVVTYLTELSAAFNSWYAAERIIVDGTVAGYTLELIKAFEQTLAKGLQVLGIPAPEKM